MPVRSIRNPHTEEPEAGSLVAWAKQLGRPDRVSALRQSLYEEYAVDRKRTKLAEAHLNRKAA